MAKVTVALKPGWIHDKDTLVIDDGFIDILDFYLFSTPCEETSSSGITLRHRGWPNNIWQRKILRHSLLEIANLEENVTYCKTTKQNLMSTAINSAGLNGNFHLRRDRNRIAFWASGKCPEFMDVFYYIRCSLAHGRFERYVQDEEVIYVMESAQKTKVRGLYNVKARMILKESTLREWASLLRGGNASLQMIEANYKRKICAEIIGEIEAGNNTKRRIITVLPYSTNEINDEFRTLKSINRILYNKQLHVWETVPPTNS